MSLEAIQPGPTHSEPIERLAEGLLRDLDTIPAHFHHMRLKLACTYLQSALDGEGDLP